MKIIYADPPYIGQAKAHYSHDPKCAEVDHSELINYLMTFDGWALSASSVSLWQIARLQNPDGSFVVPENTRIGTWVKPFASFKPGVNPAYAWEPVLFMPARGRGRDLPTVRDWVSANITMRRGLHGAKPEKFCFWLFDVLGMTPDDEFVDMFPGSGAVQKAHQAWRSQLPLRGLTSRAVDKSGAGAAPQLLPSN